MRHRYIVAVLSLAACGSSTSATSGGGAYGAQTTKAATATTATTTSGGGGGYAVPPPPSSSAPAGPANLTIITTSLGQAVGDASGFALYMYMPDTGGTPTCTDTCAANWPPAATTGAPTAATGLDTKLLTTVMHPNGVTQVVYNGHPLYRYGGDAAPGDIGGEGRLGYWYLITSAGAKIAG